MIPPATLSRRSFARLAAGAARMHGVRAEQVLLGAGSGEILKWAAATFTGPGKMPVDGRAHL